MKKTNIKRRIMAVILSVALIFTAVAPVSASAMEEKTALALGQVFDRVWDVLADAIIGVVTNALLSADHKLIPNDPTAFPTVDEYFAEEHEYFYEGTDGEVKGDGWKLGYSSESVIPEKWRRNADKKKDPNGYRLNKFHFFGGYFGSTVNNIYDDERIALTVMSAGADANKNGIDDIIIISSIDNIGVANGNVRDVRKAVSDALIAKAGIAADDIIAFEFNSTHAHTVLEALGMSLDWVFINAIGNHFLFRKDRSIENDLKDAICEKAAKAAVDAYGKMEDGSLYYFETANVNDFMKKNACNGEEIGDTLRDKLEYGAANQEFFACWYFESESGVKTIMANTGLHPTFAGRQSDRVCADVPHYMWKAMTEAGYQFMFLQGSQAAIGLSSNYTEEGKKWAEDNALTYEDWVERYGQKYADKHFAGNDKEDGEAEYFRIRATGYSLAHFIIDNIDRSNKVAPKYDIKMGETIIPLDYSIMYLAAVSAIFGYNTVQYPDSETGYGIITEIGYVQLGDDVVMITLPGEVSPAITFGTNPNYTGEDTWKGAKTWNGKDWDYDTLANYAKAALGQDKHVIALGITNDEIGYVMPDCDTAKNFLTKTFLASADGLFGRADNEELMSASQHAGSALAEGYKEFFAK